MERVYTLFSILGFIMGLKLSFFVFFLSIIKLCSDLYAAKPKALDLENVMLYENAQFFSLEELSTRYDAFLLDAYGVFWGSNEVGVLPGAADAMAYLVSRGKQVGILSNSTQLAAKEKEKLRKHGLYEGAHYHFLLTSGEVAKDLLTQRSLPFSTPRNTYCLFGILHPRFGSHLQIFEGTKYKEVDHLHDADFLYISIPHIDGVDQEDPEIFRPLIQSMQHTIPILCVNPDRFAMEGSPPRPVVRQGSIAQMFAEQQANVYLIGKPSKVIYEAALQYFSPDMPKEKILMIGDTPETDIRGAHEAGLNAALVTKTGIMAHLLEKQGVVAVMQQLPLGDRPDFFLESLNTGL